MTELSKEPVPSNGWTNGKGPVELYKKHRPRKWSEVLGQDKAVTMLRKFVEQGRVPQTILFVGGSGVGKTTLARLLASKLGAKGQNVREINAAESRGIETVREVSQNMHLAPMGDSPCRAYIIDECHQLTQRAGGDAQTALLKTLEDTPRHVYFFLCTTHPDQLLHAIRTRCTKVILKPLEREGIQEALRSVLAKEGRSLPQKVMDKIIEHSDGSARQALVYAHEVLDLEGEEAQLEHVQPVGRARDAFELVRILMQWGKRGTWKEVGEIIEGVGADVEGFRHLVLTCAAKSLLEHGEKAARAAMVINYFRDSFKETGKPGLVSACFDVFFKK